MFDYNNTTVNIPDSDVNTWNTTCLIIQSRIMKNALGTLLELIQDCILGLILAWNSTCLITIMPKINIPDSDVNTWNTTCLIIQSRIMKKVLGTLLDLIQDCILGLIRAWNSTCLITIITLSIFRIQMSTLGTLLVANNQVTLIQIMILKNRHNYIEFCQRLEHYLFQFNMITVNSINDSQYP